MWVRFKFRITATAAEIRILSFRNSSGDSELAFLNTGLSGQLTVSIGGASASTVSVLATDTTYNVWLRFKTGSGDAVISVGFTTSDTEPTSGNDFASVTNGTQATSCSRVQFRNANDSGNGNFFFDSMTGDDAQIGDF